jgi:hypothetical protein
MKQQTAENFIKNEFLKPKIIYELPSSKGSEINTKKGI